MHLKRRPLIVGVALITLVVGTLGWCLRPSAEDSPPSPLIEATTDYAIGLGKR